MTLPVLPEPGQFLRESLSWFERLRQTISPTDEYLYYMSLALYELVRLQSGVTVISPVTPPDLTNLTTSINNLTAAVNQLTTQLGGEAPPEIIAYELEQIRKENLAPIAPGGTQVIWQTEKAEEKGSVVYIKLISNIEDVRYRLFIDRSKEIIFDVPELIDYSIEEAYPLGAWVELATGSTFAIVISGWGFEGFRYNTKFILSAENRHATSNLNITLLELLRRKAV